MTDDEREELREWADLKNRMTGNIIISREEATSPEFRTHLKQKIENLEKSIIWWIESEWKVKVL
jgi:hypothetical protein